ncbi:MAG: hypothetical protein WC985_10195 [Thermoplasmata archaeon]
MGALSETTQKTFARDQIMMPLLLPVTSMFLLALVWLLAGGIGFFLVLRRK